MWPGCWILAPSPRPVGCCSGLPGRGPGPGGLRLSLRAFMIHHRASGQSTPSQGHSRWGLQQLLSLSCVPLPTPYPDSTTELGKGLNLCPICRSLSKLCPSEYFMFLFFLTACHYRGQKHQRRRKSQGHKTSQKPHSTSYTNSGSPDCKWSPAGSRLAACLSDTVLFSTWQGGSLAKPISLSS